MVLRLVGDKGGLIEALADLAAERQTSLEFVAGEYIFDVGGLDAVCLTPAGFNMLGGLLPVNLSRSQVVLSTETMVAKGAPKYTILPGEMRFTSPIKLTDIEKLLRSVVGSALDFSRTHDEIRVIGALLDYFTPESPFEPPQLLQTFEEVLSSA
jgi:hypothetical protein